MTDRNEALRQVPSHFAEGSADHPTPPGDGTIRDDAQTLIQQRFQQAVEVATNADRQVSDEAGMVEQQRRALQRMAEADESRKES